MARAEYTAQINCLYTTLIHLFNENWDLTNDLNHLFTAHSQFEQKSLHNLSSGSGLDHYRLLHVGFQPQHELSCGDEYLRHQVLCVGIAF